MSSPVSSATYPAAIEFDCQACASILEVPFAYLNVSGPCPYCGENATAPSLESWERLHRPPTHEVMERPELRKMSSRKSVAKMRPGADNLHKLDDVWEKSPAGEKMLNPDPRSQQRVEGRLSKIREKFRRAQIARLDDSGPSLPQVLGWGTVALVLIAVGFGLAVAFYTEPLRPRPHHFEMPLNLTAQVELEKIHQGKLRTEAENQALDAVGQFLHSGSAAGGTLEMFSASGKASEFSGNVFPDLKREDLVAWNCLRIPGGEDYLVTVEPKDERGPVFILQQQKGHLLLHADALTQQAGDLLNDFLNAPGDASVVAYVLARPSLTQLPVEGLEDWPKLDITPPFPGDHPRAFLASAQPDSEAAEAIQKRTGTRHYSQAVAEFRWSKTRAANRFIELVRVLPNAWGKF